MATTPSVLPDRTTTYEPSQLSTIHVSLKQTNQQKRLSFQSNFATPDFPRKASSGQPGACCTNPFPLTLLSSWEPEWNRAEATLFWGYSATRCRRDRQQLLCCRYRAKAYRPYTSCLRQLRCLYYSAIRCLRQLRYLKGSEMHPVRDPRTALCFPMGEVVVLSCWRCASLCTHIAQFWMGEQKPSVLTVGNLRANGCEDGSLVCQPLGALKTQTG